MAQASTTMQANRTGAYQVLGRIGAGGMGVVYKALDAKLSRTVALKFLATEDVQAVDKERLLREARAASGLDHANIAAVHAVEEAEDGRLFIVMAYYEGETLAEKLRHGSLQPAKAIHLARQVARGLQHAHNHGIVHGDIKPSNVIVTNEGVAKIVDFGLARHFSASASTQTASLSGTLPYMSPEQVSGQAVDGRTDIWSLGVMLYQMLTGRLPFHAENTASTAMAILQSPPAPLGEVPERYQLVVYRALAKTPAARYQSCGELLEDLEAVSGGNNQPTATVHPHEFHRRVHLAVLSARATPRSRRWLWMAFFAALLLLAVVTRWAAPAVRARWFGTTTTSKGSSPAYDSYLKGRSYLERFDKAGNVEAAIALFQSAVKDDPNFALGFAALGEAYSYKYRLARDPQWLQQAESYSRRAIELNNRLPAVHITLGRIHSIGKNRELALQEFQQALNLDPHSPEALRGIAGVYDSIGRTSEAERLYQQAMVLSPDSWAACNDFGLFYLRHAAYDKALQQFRRAVSLTTDNAIARGNLGLALDESGQRDEAEIELKKSIALQPTYPALTMLGRLYYRQRRWADAALMVERALELNRSDYRIWANLSAAYEWLGEKAKAERAYQEELTRLEAAAKLIPDDPDIHSRLGLLYGRQRLRDQAVSHTEAALARAPERASILSNAADAYEYLGDRPRALALLQEAIHRGMTLEEIVRDPALRSLQLDPVFQKLIRNTRTTDAPR